MRCKALKPTSDSRLQDFLGTLQSFEAYLRFQPALIFPLAASRQIRRALTIRYRDSSVDPGILESRMSQETASVETASVLGNSYRIYSLKYIPYTHSTCRHGLARYCYVGSISISAEGF